MPRASKRKLKDETLQEITESFEFLISNLTHKGETEIFLSDFLTKEEKIMLAKRLVLLILIKRGYSPTFIQSALNLSYETVRSYTLKLPSKSEKFKKILDKLIKREKTSEFLEKIEKFLRPLDLAFKARTDMTARAKAANADFE